MNEAITDVSVLVAATPAIVFADPRKADELFAHIQREIATFVPDLSTVTGRKAIASLAYKVAQTKTAIDAAGAELIEDATKKVKAVNVERKRFRDQLDELRDRARKPLTDWEAAEDLRIEECKRIIAELDAEIFVTIADTSTTIAARRSKVATTVLDPGILQDFLPVAEDKKAAALTALDNAFARLTQEEADRAELEALRAAEAERQRQEETAAATERAEEQRAAEVRAEEERAAKAAEEERARIAKAAEDARLKAERDAAAALEQAEREHADALAKAERERQAVIDAAAAEKREREAKAKREADEQATRDADRSHRQDVIETAVLAIVDVAGIGSEKAKKIVLAILAGQVPNITLKF